MASIMHSSYIKRMTLSTRFRLQRSYENPTQFYRVSNPEESFCPLVLNPNWGVVTRTIKNENFGGFQRVFINDWRSDSNR
jgi:hypothetical protein